MTAPDLFHTPHYRFERLHDEWPSDPLIEWKQVERQFLAAGPRIRTTAPGLSLVVSASAATPAVQ